MNLNEFFFDVDSMRGQPMPKLEFKTLTELIKHELVVENGLGTCGKTHHKLVVIVKPSVVPG